MAYKVNSDKEVVDLIRQGLKEKGGYCPCLIEQSVDTKCPCKVFRETEECHCGLFIKDAAAVDNL